MEIKNKMIDDILYVRLKGEFDSYSSSYIREYLDSLFLETQAKQIIFDLADLDFMDSTAIGVFIGRYKKMKTRGIPIYICNPSVHAKKILKMSGLLEIMPLIS